MLRRDDATPRGYYPAGERVKGRAAAGAAQLTYTRKSLAGPRERV